MKTSCLQCSAPFQITKEDQRFLDLFEVPAPKTCPDCRLQRRLCERNTRSLYYRKCDLTGQQIISQHNTDRPFPVYGLDVWIGDQWEGTTYGREIDWTRPFFGQFQELLNIVPHPALFNTTGTMENSDYNNCTGYLKNCYLLSESDVCEDCYYSNLLKKSKDIMDSSVCYECERCYECIDCINCHSLFMSQNCLQCSGSWFLKNCHGCTDCIGCINQRNKQYMIYNEQYSKEEYEAHMAAMALHTKTGMTQLRSKADAFFAVQPQRALIIERSEGSSGDRIYDSKNAVHCFDVKDAEDCRYCQRLTQNCKTCMDFNSWGQNSECVYQCSACGDRAYNCKFCMRCHTVKNCEYSAECTHSSDLFGCIGLKNKKYCIFNKQYSKEEYETLKSKLITHMRQYGEYGEFFPMALCVFAYNESFAPDMFPMTKEEVLARGWRWYEDTDTEKRYMGADVVLPETIADVSDDICKKILICRATGKPYKVIPQELKFYRSMNIPVPEFCPDERHRQRIARRNRYKLYERPCAKCRKTIQTTYAPQTPDIVYCDDCYFAAVY